MRMLYYIENDIRNDSFYCIDGYCGAEFKIWQLMTDLVRTPDALKCSIAK